MKTSTSAKIDLTQLATDLVERALRAGASDAEAVASEGD